MMNETNYDKVLTFLRKLSRPKDNIKRLYVLRNLDETDGESAEEIFTNGTEYTEANIAIDIRDLLTSIGEV